MDKKIFYSGFFIILVEILGLLCVVAYNSIGNIDISLDSVIKVAIIGVFALVNLLAVGLIIIGSLRD